MKRDLWKWKNDRQINRCTFKHVLADFCFFCFSSFISCIFLASIIFHCIVKMYLLDEKKHNLMNVQFQVRNEIDKTNVFEYIFVWFCQKKRNNFFSSLLSQPFSQRICVYRMGKKERRESTVEWRLKMIDRCYFNLNNYSWFTVWASQKNTKSHHTKHTCAPSYVDQPTLYGGQYVWCSMLSLSPLLLFLLLCLIANSHELILDVEMIQSRFCNAKR